MPVDWEIYKPASACCQIQFCSRTNVHPKDLALRGAYEGAWDKANANDSELHAYVVR
jgi:hypothetical protein